MAKGPSFTFFSQSRSDGDGFTLIELIVVISLIVIIASLAIPFTLRSRVQSNEAVTIGNLRTISSSAEGFRSTQNPPAYPGSLDAMINSNPPYIDSAWGNSERQGYVYTYVASGDGETFACFASPRRANVSGVRSFCVDQSGVIRSYSEPGNVGSAEGCSVSGTPI